jgi:hypothetical protein
MFGRTKPPIRVPKTIDQNDLPKTIDQKRQDSQQRKDLDVP